VSRKVVLGILAWLPIVLVLALATYLAAFIVPHIPGGFPPKDDAMKEWLILLFGGAGVIALVQIIFSVVFIIDATTKAKVQGLPMALWAIGFVFFGELLFPVYWILYVMRDPATAQPAPGVMGSAA
jgi:hypothetical protein